MDRWRLGWGLVVSCLISVGCGPSGGEGADEDAAEDDAGDDFAGPTDGEEPMEDTGDASGEETDGSTGGDAEDESSTGASSEGGESEGDDATDSGGMQVDNGWFDCSLPSDCGKISWHLEPWDEGSTDCAAMLIASGQPGVIRAERLGGGAEVDETQIIVVSPGDGTVLMQSKERTCIENCPEEVPFEPVSPVQQCDVAGLDQLVADCQAQAASCEWWPWNAYGDMFENCVEVDALACTDVEALAGG